MQERNDPNTLFLVSPFLTSFPSSALLLCSCSLSLFYTLLSHPLWLFSSVPLVLCFPISFTLCPSFLLLCFLSLFCAASLSSFHFPCLCLFCSISVPLLSCSSILLLICLPFIFCSAAVPLFPLLISSSGPLSALFSYPSYPFSPAFLPLVFSFRDLLSLYFVSNFLLLPDPSLILSSFQYSSVHHY